MARLISRQDAATLLDVTPQTISNWVDKGVLTAHYSCDGRNTFLIDRKSIEKYFDTLEDLASMEKRIAFHKETLQKDQTTMEAQVKDMSSAKYLLGDGIPVYLFRDIFYSIIEVAGDTLLKEREADILRALVEGKKISYIAADYCLTRTRIMQIAERAIRKIRTMEKWPQCHRDYKRVLEENHCFTVLLETQQTRIKQLEARLNIYNSDGGGESAVPGYSKMELAKMLSRNLYDERLSARCLNCLKGADVETVCDLIHLSKTDLLKHRNFGRKSLAELERYLESLNLSFGMDLDHLIDAEVEHFLNELKNKK